MFADTEFLFTWARHLYDLTSPRLESNISLLYIKEHEWIWVRDQNMYPNPRYWRGKCEKETKYIPFLYDQDRSGWFRTRNCRQAQLPCTPLSQAHKHRSPKKTDLSDLRFLPPGPCFLLWPAWHRPDVRHHMITGRQRGIMCASNDPFCRGGKNLEWVTNKKEKMSEQSIR